MDKMGGKTKWSKHIYVHTVLQLYTSMMLDLLTLMITLTIQNDDLTLSNQLTTAVFHVPRVSFGTSQCVSTQPQTGPE